MDITSKDYLSALHAHEKILTILHDLNSTQGFVTISKYLATGAIQIIMLQESLLFDEAAKMFIDSVIIIDKQCKEEGIDNNVISSIRE